MGEVEQGIQKDHGLQDLGGNGGLHEEGFSQGRGGRDGLYAFQAGHELLHSTEGGGLRRQGHPGERSAPRFHQHWYEAGV